MTRLALPTALLLLLWVALGPSVALAQDTETPPGMSANRAQRAAPRTASAYDMGAGRDSAVEVGTGDGAETSSLSLGSVDLDAPAGRAGGVTLHRVGTGLMALGTTSLVAGAFGGMVGLIIPWGCNSDFCGGGPINIGLFSAGMVTAGLGLVTFFIGLGLDIRGRIDRGRARPLALTPDGFAISF
jgi:hypothetical protein